MPATTAVLDPSTGAADPLADPLADLADGNGARIAIVVDDVGGTDTYLADYLALPYSVTFSIIPWNAHATDDDAAIHQAGREVLLHLPLANRRGQGDGRTRLGGSESADTVDAFVARALERVPDADGANNHEGPWGSSQPGLMRNLLGALATRRLFFMDSVTSQNSVGFAVEAEVGMAPRVNNVFLDHFENDDDSMASLARLAKMAARNGTAIGICHVHHPYLAHALAAAGPRLAAKGYALMPLSQVTNGLAGGLDKGVRSKL